eukprot:8251036-Lingulodinium_polyedra.AAC.1
MGMPSISRASDAVRSNVMSCSILSSGPSAPPMYPRSDSSRPCASRCKMEKHLLDHPSWLYP